jgi:hypothetical protein
MLWKFKIKTFLKVREFWSLVGGIKQNPVVTTANGFATYTKWENCILNIIIQNLSNSQLMTMRQETIA